MWDVETEIAQRTVVRGWADLGEESDAEYVCSSSGNLAASDVSEGKSKASLAVHSLDDVASHGTAGAGDCGD